MMKEYCYFCRADIRLKRGGWYYYTRLHGYRIFCKECSENYKKARQEFGNIDFPENLLARQKSVSFSQSGNGYHKIHARLPIQLISLEKN